jgi:HD superfamily phosphohydrolase
LPSLRDPLWNNIRIDGAYLRLLDAAPFQRLRYVRQLGLAHLVYPGATHSRFEHACGAFHLASETVRVLGATGSLDGLPAEEGAIVTAAALLHDVGHYPFSHALEELGVPHHEKIAGPLIAGGEIGEILRAEFTDDAPERVLALVRGERHSRALSAARSTSTRSTTSSATR